MFRLRILLLLTSLDRCCGVGIPALLGGKTNRQKTDREEARGKREMHARAKWLKTWSLGGGISGGGERGDHSHQWIILHNPKYRPELSVWVAAVRGLEPKPPYNKHAIWARQPELNRERV